MANTHEHAVIRVRFLRDCNRDLYVHVNEIDHLIEENTSFEDNLRNSLREREIFLRASLQLLNKTEVPRDGPYSARKGARAVADSGDMYDVIRFGIVKKFSRPGKFSAINAGNMSHWKVKYVELRHGVFSYEDCHGYHLPSFHDIKPVERSTRRFIHLSIDSCICRVAEVGLAPSRIFEIAVVGGPRRFWMANSPQECIEWVKAIHAAMVGNSFGKVRGIDLNENCAVLHSNLIADGGDLPPPLSSKDTNSFANQPHSQSNDLPWLSMEGAAAPYAEDMSLFMHLHNSFVEAVDEESYRQLLVALQREHVQITIPVLFIKSKTTCGNFLLSPQDSLNAQNFVPLFNSSQVWKDLQRDVIVVNGERISGEMGAEAMIGALVRHISDKAEHIRILQQKTQLSHMGIDRNGSEKLVQSNFEISESLIVECARDLIVLCNRTQSGGDTYFCVEALLCGERTDSKTILTPLSAEADPLSFSIDVVLISNVVAPCSDVGAPMHLHRSEPLEHASPRDPDLGNSKYMESKSAGVPKDSKGDDKKAHRVHSLGPGAFDVDHSPSTQRSSANLQKKMLHSSNAAKERRRSHLSSKPLGGSAIPCSEGNEADVSDSCKPSENGKDRQSKEQEKDKPKIGLTTRRFSNSSLVDSNVSETSETEGKARSITPKRRRKPQLDLRGELDLEGFHFNYLASSSPMRKSSPLTDVHVLEDVDLTSPFAASVGEPPETVDTQLYDSGRHEQFLSEIPIVVGQKDEEFSVISELTYDTFSRSAMNNNGRAKMPLNQNGEPTIRQTPAGFRENPSILKQLGKSLKPFKLPTVSESFEGISSPFRNMRRRGSNTNRYAESPSVPSGAQSSATGPQKAGRSSSHDRTPNMATRERNCSEANATCSSDILDSTSQCSNGSLHTICIRVKVQAVSRYKVCSSNPSGIESADTWASVRGIFTQTFLIGANGGQHLGMADRLVSIDIEECNTPHEVLGQP